MKTIEFYYDFGSPNAYLVHKVLPRIAQRTAAGILFKPMFLGGVFKATGNTSPGLAGVKGKMAYLLREADRFVKRHDLPFTWNPHFPVMSIHLMRGAIYAQRHPWEARYIDAVFDACWVTGDNMSDLQVIGNRLAEAGLPAAEILDALATPEIKAGLFDATEVAVKRGIFGAPSMFVGDEMFFGKDSLAEMEAELET